MGTPSIRGSASVNFDVPDLAAKAAGLQPSELNKLPFGVMRLKRDGTILLYSETEARRSGYNASAQGKNLFAICDRFNGDDFRGRIERGLDRGQVDFELGWTGDYGNPRRDLRIRVQSLDVDSIWVFVERDG